MWHLPLTLKISDGDRLTRRRLSLLQVAQHSQSNGVEMRREPSLTFRGALEILGHREHRVIERLDKLLGGVILAAGAGAGIAAANPTLAPLGMFAAVWGWLEQRDEALRLLRAAVDSVSGKLVGTGTYERRQLIAAAHTTIVVAAFFEALQELIGPRTYDQLRISDADKEMVAANQARRGDPLYDFLYSAEIPAPSPACGFEENCSQISRHMKRMAEVLKEILSDVRAINDRRAEGRVAPINWIEWGVVQRRAVERYRSRYLELAASVPEFMIWAMLGEHAATRASVTRLRADMAQALDGSRDALNRVAALLTIDRFPIGDTNAIAMPQPRIALARANGGVLSETILPEDARIFGSTITFPAVRSIYINPRYRLVRYDTSIQDMRPTDEQWWQLRPSYEDFDLMLTGHMASPDATRLPMLLLGHPGAGKSLLMKVLAARLPPEEYTVVRVPLRRVDSNAPLINQVQQALSLATNRRFEWWQLAEQSEGSVRVVLLDGLDELLQASEHDRSGYLQEVAEFQRLEAEQDGPVVVIVTSRTVVADRVNIPSKITIVKLDPFNDADIADWLGRWHQVNAAAIAAGTVRALKLSAVRSQPDLAAQPLLLLMLAIYAADPKLPSLDEGLSTAELYRRLLEGFTRREAAKDLGFDLHSDELNDRTRDHLERLAVAALAMFNRGRQDIDEESLGHDLSVLDSGLMTRTRPVEAGQRIIGEFFFVHAPEARMLTGPEISEVGRAGRNSDQRQPRRAYEFLHATFGEYLVAARVTDEICDLAERAFPGRRGPGIPDDDLLFALLSHQSLAARVAALDFAAEIFAELSDEERRSLCNILELLLSEYRSRHSSGRYAGYQPAPPDQIRQLACYSANLIALRLALEPGAGQILLSTLLRMPHNEALQQWRSTVRLWKAGLDADGFQAMLRIVWLTDETIGISPRPGSTAQTDATDDIAFSRLVNDVEMERRLRYGAAIIDRYTYSREDSWYDNMASAIIPRIIGRNVNFIPASPPTGTPDDQLASIAKIISCCLRSGLSDASDDAKLLQLLFSLPTFSDGDPLALAGAVISNPELPSRFSVLKNAKIFGRYAGIVDRIRSHVLPREIDLQDPTNEIAVAIREVIKRTNRNWQGDPSDEYGND